MTVNKWPRRIAAVLAIGLLVGSGVYFRGPLQAWFGVAPAPSIATGASAGMSAMPGMDHAPAKPPAELPPELPKAEYSATRLASLQTALLAYEDLRSALASDAADGLAGPAKRLEAALRVTLEGEALDARIREAIDAAVAAAQEIQGADGLEDARKAFGTLSKQLVAVVATDERLAKGEHLFKCPMADGYAHWMQPTAQLSNPYMGQKMLTCGSEVSLEKHLQPAEEQADHSHPQPGSDEIAHWTCPMHPSVKQPTAGQCPICGMDLVPVTKVEVESGVIIVDAARRQRIGVKFATVEKRALKKQLRAVGRITYDETRIFDVTVKFKGFIQQLFADSTGKRVKRGHSLFTIYSPEIYQAQQDLIIAKQSATAFGGDAGLLGSGASKGMEEAAKQRLSLLDVPRSTIKRVVKSGKPMRYVPIVSPASGYVVEKNVFEGSAVEPGMRLMRIADLDEVWIETELYEAELPLVKVGTPAVVTLPYLPDKKFEGTVSFVYPYLSGSTRTGKVRIELKNRDVELKPDMYANVSLSADRGERLVVPVSAVIYAGPRRLVFLDLGEGRLKPQEIKVGIKAGDDYEVLEGLEEGDRVVSSGNFLIAAESRLKSAEGQW